MSIAPIRTLRHRGGGAPYEEEFAYTGSIVAWVVPSSGVYQIELSLPPGTYDYAYYTGVTSFPDKTNPHRSYNPDGKVASRLVIE